MYNKGRENIGRFRTSNFCRLGLSAQDEPVAGEVRNPNDVVPRNSGCSRQSVLLEGRTCMVDPLLYRGSQPLMTSIIDESLRYRITVRHQAL